MSFGGKSLVEGIGNVVFLTADPVPDVANAAKVYGVLDNGRFHLFADLTKEFQ